MIYTPGTTSGHNLKISRDKGVTWELQNCSYAPNGKIIIGGTNNNEWVISSINTNAVVTYSLDSGVTWHQSTIPTSNNPATFVNINAFYHHNTNTWYFSNYNANEFAKTVGFTNWVLFNQTFDDTVYGEDVTYSVCQFNQMFSKGARIYVVVKTLAEINYSDNIYIPNIRYTDDDFVTTTIQVDPQYTRNPSIDQYNEYRYIWTDNNSINNDIYFIDSSFKKIFKTTNGFQSSALVYDGSSTLSGINVVNSALSKDYLFMFNTSTYGGSKMYQLRRDDNTSTFTSPQGIGTIFQNTTVACCANENNESYLLTYKNASPTGIKVFKSTPDSLDYIGTYTNGASSNSTDTWISSIPNGIKMIWKNNVVVTPGQTFSVTLSGGDSSAIFRWGTGNNIVI